MLFEALSSVFEALERAQVRYLVAGGLAVVAHGHTRVTHDLDLVVALDPENSRKALEALCALGFRPRLPVDAMDFCDPEIRSSWVREKNLQVFSLIRDDASGLVVDLFAVAPFDFDEEWRRAYRADLPGLPGGIPFVCRKTLLEMKRAAGRPVDLEDLRRLGGPDDED